MKQLYRQQIGQELIKIVDRIYIINLEFRRDRLLEISDQLALVGLAIGTGHIRRFDAVRPAEAGPWPSVGARGCYMSHLNILREAAAGGVQSIAIIEDDLDWSSAFLGTSPQDITLMGQGGWQYLHAGTNSGASPVRTRYLSPDQKLLQTHFVAFRGDAIARAVAYLEAMAARPPGSSDGGPMHVDGAYNWFRSDNPDITAALCDPAIGHQRSSGTDISSKRWFDSTPLVRDFTRLARKAKRFM